jgi:hypothetical protein
MVRNSDIPVHENEGWKSVAESASGVVQVRKLAQGVYMLRHGIDGTAVALTEAQLAILLERRAN